NLLPFHFTVNLRSSYRGIHGHLILPVHAAALPISMILRTVVHLSTSKEPTIGSYRVRPNFFRNPNQWKVWIMDSIVHDWHFIISIPYSIGILILHPIISTVPNCLTTAYARYSNKRYSPI